MRTKTQKTNTETTTELRAEAEAKGRAVDEAKAKQDRCGAEMQAAQKRDQESIRSGRSSAVPAIARIRATIAFHEAEDEARLAAYDYRKALHDAEVAEGDADAAACEPARVIERLQEIDAEAVACANSLKGILLRKGALLSEASNSRLALCARRRTAGQPAPPNLASASDALGTHAISTVLELYAKNTEHLLGQLRQYSAPPRTNESRIGSLRNEERDWILSEERRREAQEKEAKERAEAHTRYEAEKAREAAEQEKRSREQTEKLRAKFEAQRAEEERLLQTYREREAKGSAA